MILAIDTATRTASVALYDDGVLDERTWRAPGAHTAHLVPNIAELLNRQGRVPGELAGLAVAIGPGSFTGLRIGLSVAKGFALGLGLPIAAVPTLDVTFYPHRHAALPVWAAIEAGRGRVYAALYRPGLAPPAPTDYYHGPLAALPLPMAGNTGEALLCGEFDRRWLAPLLERAGGRLTDVGPAAGLRRAGCLAEMGLARLAAGQAEDLAALSPIYLSQPAGQTDGGRG